MQQQASHLQVVIAPVAAPATATEPAIFVCNVPLVASNSLEFDKIATAFHNSMHKTLSFVPPTTQNGEIVVRPSLDVIRNRSRRWSSTAVGYFLGRRPYFHHVKDYARSIWPRVHEVTTTSNGFFFFQFETTAAMEEVIEGGPWLLNRQPIILQKWEPGMVLRKLQHTQVPVWIKLRHLPVELWTNKGLSMVASGIGKPLYPDAITRACTRLDFARVCVMLDIGSKLPKHIVTMIPREDSSEVACKADVEYEWLPPKCTTCMSLGHPTKDCPKTKPKPPPVEVYVQKPPPPRREHVRREPRPTALAPTCPSEASGGVEMDKAIVLYNAFDMLMELDAIWNVRGLNRRDHQVSVLDLASDYRLQFIGLLETRVAVGNVARVQRGMFPQWRWFVDYAGPGNRIWLAWDDDCIGVDVLETGNQFIHCSVLIRSFHARVFITVVYGYNDVIGRRELWEDLHRICMGMPSEPWLVGGDFNAMIDASEVCGQSGDIRLAVEEFRGCLRGTWLTTLPLQGEWFTWHNCSSDSRSLWKQLDKLLANDWWFDRWPSAYYLSLNARTSDHSPIVLWGDAVRQSVGMFRFDNYLAHLA
ncbi:UNVERIFIED_CONTAM: hypothetical protein Sradi_6878500 [Sesamum radiatum]|uniref:DUF4283 domain-containing protein n=1 Tax=Sesamum radiatum TaxID=300843 RepID=A0AAW2JKP2_SESRA